MERFVARRPLVPLEGHLLDTARGVPLVPGTRKLRSRSSPLVVFPWAASLRAKRGGIPLHSSARGAKAPRLRRASRRIGNPAGSLPARGERNSTASPTAAPIWIFFSHATTTPTTTPNFSPTTPDHHPQITKSSKTILHITHKQSFINLSPPFVVLRCRCRVHHSPDHHPKILHITHKLSFTHFIPPSVVLRCCCRVHHSPDHHPKILHITHKPSFINFSPPSAVLRCCCPLLLSSFAVAVSSSLVCVPQNEGGEHASGVLLSFRCCPLLLLVAVVFSCRCRVLRPRMRSAKRGRRTRQRRSLLLPSSSVTAVLSCRCCCPLLPLPCPPPSYAFRKTREKDTPTAFSSPSVVVRCRVLCCPCHVLCCRCHVLCCRCHVLLPRMRSAKRGRRTRNGVPFPLSCRPLPCHLLIVLFFVYFVLIITQPQRYLYINIVKSQMLKKCFFIRFLC